MSTLPGREKSESTFCPVCESDTAVAAAREVVIDIVYDLRAESRCGGRQKLGIDIVSGNTGQDDAPEPGARKSHNEASRAVGVARSTYYVDARVDRTAAVERRR
jgi:hypothetical protein